MEAITKFQERFNECLKYENIVQSDLARAVGITRQCISNYKAGRSVPSIDTLCLICKYLEVSSDYLLGLED